MLVLGHRGDPGRHPENSIDGFLSAVASGADGVELDVRMTSDERLVLRHDDEIEPGRSVSSSTLDQMRAWGVAVPALRDALDALAGAVVVVELKTQPGRNDRFADLVAAELAGRDQRLVVSSFDPTLLRRVRQVAGRVTTGLLLGSLAGPDQVVASVAEALDAGHAQIHPRRTILAGPHGDDLVARSAAAGLGLVAWTVNDAGEAGALMRRGLAGVITDRPADVVAAVRPA